ncbi:MAG: hypothetical protein RR351_01255 [Christensenella sp.]
MKKLRRPANLTRKSQLTAIRALRFSKKVVIFVITIVIIFALAVFVSNCISGQSQDTLITELIGFFKVEGGTLGLIKVAETIVALFREIRNGNGNEDNNDDGNKF